MVPALPFGVAAIVAKALALAPDQRFADMDEIVDEIAALLQPIAGAVPASPPIAEPRDGAVLKPIVGFRA